ncbi:MAG: ABC transporter ATP-binding protein [Acidimicrobiales bacterium]
MTSSPPVGTAGTDPGATPHIGDTPTGTCLPPDAAPVLQVRDVLVRYGGVAAVSHVSFDLLPGQILGLIGPNGAGKSSLLSAIGGQHRAQGGAIVLQGRDVTGRAPYTRARLGIVRTFQTTSEFEAMTVFENLLVAGRGAVGASLWRVSTRWSANRAAERRVAARAWEVLDRFEMSDVADAYGRELSGGQRRLVEIMRCLMCEPSVLLLDEPMVGVAPHLVAKLVGDLRTVAADGIALILVEHALEVVQQLCDVVVVMAMGEVIAQGPYDAVVRDEGVRSAYLA